MASSIACRGVVVFHSALFQSAVNVFLYDYFVQLVTFSLGCTFTVYLSIISSEISLRSRMKKCGVNRIGKLSGRIIACVQVSCQKDSLRFWQGLTRETI